MLCSRFGTALLWHIFWNFGVLPSQHPFRRSWRCGCSRWWGRQIRGTRRYQHDLLIHPFGSNLRGHFYQRPTGQQVILGPAAARPHLGWSNSTREPGSQRFLSQVTPQPHKLWKYQAVLQRKRFLLLAKGYSSPERKKASPTFTTQREWV